jgi:hypothetical protein
MVDTTGTIIWKRHYDKTSHNRRMKRFYTYYLIPATIAIVLMAIIKGIYPALGLLILLGLFGLLLFGWFWMIGFNLRMHPTVVEDDGYLCQGKQKVPINQISTYTSFVTQAIFGEAMCRDLVYKGFAATAGIPMAMLRMDANPLWAIDRCRASQKSLNLGLTVQY